MTIAFFDSKPYDREFFDRENASYGYELRHFPVKLGPDTASLAAGSDAVCAFVNDDLGAQTLSALEGLGVKLVALRCAGYNNVDLKAAFGKMHVVRVPAYSPHAVAEHAVALLLSLNRKTHRAYFRTRDGNFSLNGLLGFDLYGKTAGVFGTGKIGKIAAGILKGFGMRVLVSDPFPDQAWADASGVSYVGPADLYREADVISLHCPLTAETTHMIRSETLVRMKKGVLLINTGRGALIDTPALVEGLKSGHIGGAALDVYEEEDQWFFEDHSSTGVGDDVLARLLTFPNVLVTAHQAFFTAEALTAIARTSLENLKEWLSGGNLSNEICYRCMEGNCPRKTTGKCF